MSNIFNRDTLITFNEVYYAVKQLADNKASGSDHITAEHIKFATPKATALLAICFTGFINHVA